MYAKSSVRFQHKPHAVSYTLYAVTQTVYISSDTVPTNKCKKVKVITVHVVLEEKMNVV